MCGILGVYKKNGLDIEQFIKQVDLIYHRGPDDFGYWFDDTKKLGLGSRRLSIQDISNNGHMPMTAQDENYVIIFNGEIYNHEEIRLQLSNLGYNFKSKSDTEVVLNSYIAWSHNCLLHLNGMFSIAIFDKKNNQLFLARDRAGEKPLYYWDSEFGFSFSSELKQIIYDNQLSKDLNIIAFKQYLEDGFIKGEQTFIKNVFKLLPGHYLIYDLISEKKIIETYWEIPPYNNNNLSKHEILSKLDFLLSEAVKRQMISDVPLGVLLSGGIDSSLITSYAAEHSSSKIKTFNISFNGFGKYDESVYAKKISNYYDTEHTELSGNEIEFNLIDEILEFFDEPLGDSSILPTYLVSKLTKNHVTVALGGDGGDELFGGYTSYYNFINPNKFYKYTPKAIRNVLSYSGSFLPSGLKGRNFLINSSGSATERFLHNRLFDPYDIKRILSKEFYNKISDIKLKSSFENRGDLLYNMTSYDFQNYLVDDILVKVDRASMASSLELRAPFLDRHIIEFAFSEVRSDFKLNNQGLKLILKDLLKKRLPIDFEMNRKQGFSIPLNNWIANKWHSEFIDEISDLKSIFNKEYILKMCDNVKNGYSNSSKLFAIIILNKWLKKYNINF